MFPRRSMLVVFQPISVKPWVDVKKLGKKMHYISVPSSVRIMVWEGQAPS